MNTNSIPFCAGVILAGGNSCRFGSNKALVRLRGKPLIKHVTDILTPLFTTCLLVTNSPEEYAFLGLPMTGDQWQGAGPLAGIHASLIHIREPFAFVTGCDLPFIHAEVISLLCRLVHGYCAAVPCLDHGLEPLCAIYHKNCLPIIEEQLVRGERKIGRIFSRLPTRLVTEKEILGVVQDLSSFYNINRPEDLHQFP